MNSIRITTIVAVVFLVTAASVSHAQPKVSNYEIGIHAGTLIYQGDLSRSYIGNYRSIKPAVGLSVSKSLDSYFSLRANLTFGKISEDEHKYSTPRWKQFRAFNFSTPVTELSALLVFNPFGQKNDRRLTPYIFGGAGITFLNIKRDWSKYDSAFYDPKSQVQIGLGTDTLHTPPKLIPVLPLGAGLRYALSSQLSLIAEATYRFTATDYLDGFKYSANANRKDSYYGLSIGISYRFGGYKCPPVRN